jgi:transcriptional regulator with XRE-family HTH domain
LDLSLRQSDVAKLLGAYTSTVNTWEKGHFTPDVRFVPRIVEFLGYDPFGPPPTAARLKAARVAAGLTRRQLAVEVRVQGPTVGPGAGTVGRVLSQTGLLENGLRRVIE